jgi:tyrosinase
MTVQITFPKYDSQNRTFVTWRPVEVKLKVSPAVASPANIAVKVVAKTTATGGGLVFAKTLTHLGTPTLDLDLPGNGTPVSVWVGGQFPKASLDYGDVTMEVRDSSSNALLGSQPLMVRVRKNANGLTPAERDRFLAALATLNGSGVGLYKNFRDMHVGGPPDVEAHGGPGFLSWHRAYLLDFERELQNIDARVALHYWRFDRANPNLFSKAFIGLPNSLGQVQFNAGHPLLGWIAVNAPGIQRGTGVTSTTVPALNTEAQTLQSSPGTLHANYSTFRNMQFNPHGSAHMSHVSGWITNPATAPRDPLFYLLHCNVDRLWAKWQWATKIHDPADPRAFTPSAGFPAGHRLNDPLWPWCGPLPSPRPTTAPGGTLATSPMTATPGASPKHRDMIDYLGTIAATHQAFAYDDVPFQK